MTEVRRLGGDPPSPWETEYGFSRLVVAGGMVHLGGTTSVGPAGTVIGNTPYEQTIEVLRRVVCELGRAGATLDHIVALRVYVTDIPRAQEVGRAFSEVLGAVKPLMTMVEVSGLIDPRMLVEIEATACAPS